MQKINNKYCGCQQIQEDRTPMNPSGNVISCSSCLDCIVLPSHGKYQSSSAFGFRGVARRNYFLGFQSRTSEIGFMASSNTISTWSGRTPRRVSPLVGLHLEGESCIEIDGSKPTNLDALEWVYDFNTFICEDDSWLYHQGEEQGIRGQTIDCAQERFVHFPCKCKSKHNAQLNNCDECEVNPVATGSVGIGTSHGTQTTLEKCFETASSFTKKGANKDGN